ncbi:hypothetical protein [Cellulomonas sp. ICMP 17802]|uniref:hypothetical protein n=1 Tax=Cellulomonas sp. ICMP 17802 TaxID=3239199 RepID=UPI00351AF3D9
METVDGAPSPDDAAAALAEAEHSRERLAHDVALPSYFHTSIGAAVALQIGTTALALAGVGPRPVFMVEAGILVLAVVAFVQLRRFRRLNGLWVSGLASRVVGGTATAASVSYALGLGGAIWAAFEAQWALVVVCSVAGGVAYALSGRRWVRLYRSDPSAHSRGESAAWLVCLVVVALAGLALLLIGR